MRILALLLALLLPSLCLAAPKINLTTANTVAFRGVVDGASTQRATVQLMDRIAARGQHKYPIYLVLDSPGGSIMAGEDFIAFARTLPNVETISIFAASMASAIVEALPGKRTVVPNGVLMFHRAKGTLEGQFETGELESQLEFYKKFVRAMEQRSADRMSMSLADYKAKIANEWWLYGSDSVVAKAADDVAEITCSKALTDAREVVTEVIFIFKVQSTFSGCPLLRQPLETSAGE